MSLHRIIKHEAKKKADNNSYAKFVYEMLESAVKIDVTGLNINLLEPEWGKEFCLPPFKVAWIEERFEGIGTYGIVVRQLSREWVINLITEIEKIDINVDNNQLKNIGKDQLIGDNIVKLWGDNKGLVAGGLHIIPFMWKVGLPVSQGYPIVVPFDKNGCLFFKGKPGEPEAGVWKMFDLSYPPEPSPTTVEEREIFKSTSISATHEVTLRIELQGDFGGILL